MYQLKKIVPPQREVLKGITLAFYPDAKIGVLGPNGAGKSTLLRIMAGVDTEFIGDARLMEGRRAGLLAQEPQLDQTKDVRGNVEDGVAAQRSVLKRYEELSAKFAEDLSPGEMEKVSADFQRTQDEIEAKGLWDLDERRRRCAVEKTKDSARQRTLAREAEWVRASPRARQAKSKARIESYERLLAEEPERRERELEISIPPGPRLGDVVIEADGVRKGYGDRLLFDDLTFKLPRGGIVGVIGPNGAGKTTPFRLITGEAAPDAGALRVGETVKLAYVSQSRDTLTPTKTVWEEISDGQDQIDIRGQLRNSRAYVASFNLRGQDQNKRVGDLSGGERNRVHLAKLLRSGGNVLLLDEPTNDLDVDTLRALEEALLDFAGCVVVISHDRWFLDRIATHMLVFEGDSRVRWLEGNYQAYEEQMRKEHGSDWEPHRIKYRPLMRA